MNMESSIKILYINKDTHLIVLVSKLYINKIPLITDSGMVSDKNREFWEWDLYSVFPICKI